MDGYGWMWVDIDRYYLRLTLGGEKERRREGEKEKRREGEKKRRRKEEKGRKKEQSHRQ